MTGIIGIILSFFSSGGSILMGIVSALGGLALLFAFAKKTGVKEAEGRARIRALEQSYDAEKTRRKLDEDVNTLTDDELEQLRRQYDNRIQEMIRQKLPSGKGHWPFWMDI